MDPSILTAKSEFTEQILETVAQNFGISIKATIIILAVIMIWEFCWKMVALWKSARKGSVIWFIVLALVNTVGILPILYIFVFSKMGEKKKVSAKKRSVKKFESKKKKKR